MIVATTIAELRHAFILQRLYELPNNKHQLIMHRSVCKFCKLISE